MKVIKIGAIWCPGCIIMKPRWKEIEEEHPNLQTVYYDYDEHEEMLLERYHIKDTLPVCIFLDNNEQELTRLIGEASRNEILNILQKYKDF